MRKNVIVLTVTVLSLLFLTSAGYADIGAEFDDGKVQIREAQWMMEKGKMMKEANFDDKKAIVNEGHLMISEGSRMIESGMRMDSTKGHANLQEMGMMTMNAGRMLLKKGKQKEPLSEKDKQEIKKKGENLEALGKRMFEGGKLMSGQ